MSQRSLEELEERQIRAIRITLELGRKLQVEHPEIRDMYRSMPQPEILKELDLKQKYGVSYNIARVAITKALRGHAGGFGVSAYSGTMDEEELNRLEKLHKRDGSSKVGTATYKQKRGIHGLRKSGLLTFKEKKGLFSLNENELKEAAKKGGESAVSKRVGIHLLSSEDKSNAGKSGCLSRGYLLWTDEEVGEAVELSKLQENSHAESHTFAGRPDWNKITAKINEIWHEGKPVRSSATVCSIVRRRKAKLDLLRQ
jgi:hypothetical protein